MRTSSIAGYLLCLVVAGSCAVGSSDEPASAPVTTELHRVIVDYSPTVSDVGGLMYLLAHPSVDVVAVTLPGTGEAGCELGIEVTIGILAMFEQSETPVSCDPEIPVHAHNWPAEFLAGQDELGRGLDTSGTTQSLEPPADLIARVVSEPGPPVVIYAVAPLTNIAAAIRSHPELVETVTHLVVMGGAVDAPGNVEGQQAEWNFWIDIPAAATVIASGIPVTLVPLDATNDVPVIEAYIRALEQSEPTAANIYLTSLVTSFPAVTSGFYYMWDELAASIAAGESTVSTETIKVKVVESGNNIGQTVRSDSGAPITLATGVPNPEEFYAGFVRRLAGQVASDD